MNKLFLALGLLGGCGDDCVERAERYLGQGASCTHQGDYQVTCRINNTLNLCFTQGGVYCIEVTPK
jgi:hypothetical protein